MAKTEPASGHVTASVLISVLGGLASGALYGGILGSFIRQQYLIAVIAALLAVVTVTALRYFVIFRGAEFTASRRCAAIRCPFRERDHCVGVWRLGCVCHRFGSSAPRPTNSYWGWSRAVRWNSYGAIDGCLIQRPRRRRFPPEEESLTQVANWLARNGFLRGINLPSPRLGLCAARG